MNMAEVVKHARAIRVCVCVCLYLNRITILLTMLLFARCVLLEFSFMISASRDQTHYSAIPCIICSVSLAPPRVCSFCVSNPYIATPKLIANAFPCNRRPFLLCSVLLHFFFHRITIHHASVRLALEIESNRKNLSAIFFIDSVPKRDRK